MVDPVRVQTVSVVGRLTAPDPLLERIFFTFNADFSAPSNIIFDMAAINQQGVFGGPIRSMFMDNSSNPNEVQVYVEGTDSFFTVPAFAQGIFNIDANVNSVVRFETEGGADDQVTITVYNYEKSPAVWYRYGASNKDVAQKVQGANPNETLNIDGTEFPNPFYIAGRTAAGELVAVSVDDDGKLDFSSSITIGDVGIVAPDAGAIVSVASSLASVQLIAANPNRKGLVIFNDSTEILQVALANVDAAAVYSFLIYPGQTSALNNGDYTGRINGAWQVVDGVARVTELT